MILLQLLSTTHLRALKFTQSRAILLRHQSLSTKNDNNKADTINVPSKRFKPFPFEYHQIISLTITDLTNLGKGIGRFLLPDGGQWVVHVPFVIPGEEVLCKIFSNYASYSDADLIEIVKPSPDRVEPACKYYGVCGGCQYQHISVPAQRVWKRKQVEQLLARIGGFNVTSPQGILPVNEVVGTDEIVGYRVKVSPYYYTKYIT